MSSAENCIAVIITTTAERSEYLSVCLASLQEERERGVSLVAYVICNGSTTFEVDEAYDWVELIPVGQSTSLAATHNLGLSRAKEGECNFALILNDDTKVQPGMCTALVEAYEAAPDAIISPVQMKWGSHEAIDDQAIEFIGEMQEYVGDAILGRELAKVYPTRYIVGAVLFAHLDTFERLGPFDELFPFYCVDDDYCDRAHHHGVPLMIAPYARLNHMHGRFQDGEASDPERWFFRWRTHQFGRVLLGLKNHKRPLPLNYLFEGIRVTGQVLGCLLLNAWPRGAIALVVAYLSLVGRIGTVAKHRREHYAPRA